MGMFSRSYWVCIQVVFIVMLSSGMGHAEELGQKFNDPSRKSLEAGAVTLVQNNNGTVVEIRVQDCELCNRTSYLPRRELEVKYANETIGEDQFAEYSGRPGTIVFSTNDYMVKGVYYWMPRVVEDGQ